MSHDRIHRDLDIQRTGKDVEKIDGQKGKDKKKKLGTGHGREPYHSAQHQREKEFFCTMYSNFQ
jgi:hypothetical protein